MRKTDLACLLIEFILALGIVNSDNLLYLANAYRNELYFNSPDLKNMNLSEMLKSEKKKLGLDNVKIILELEKDEDIGRFLGMKEGAYHIKINPDYSVSFALKHELFHLKRIHFKEYMNYPILDEFEEWMATSYAIQESQNP